MLLRGTMTSYTATCWDFKRVSWILYSLQFFHYCCPILSGLCIPLPIHCSNLLQIFVYVTHATLLWSSLHSLHLQTLPHNPLLTSSLMHTLNISQLTHPLTSNFVCYAGSVNMSVSSWFLITLHMHVSCTRLYIFLSTFLSCV